MPDNRKRVADAAFLLAVMFFMLVGTASVPPHGDEYMQIAMARDYFAVTSGSGSQLAYQPPVQPDTYPYLRLINGTLNANLIGLTMQLAGRGTDQLPGIFAWAMPVDWNRAQGNIPPDEVLNLARWSSSIFTALGSIPLFLIAWRLRLRSVAYPAVLLYGLHPAILINGRRAMMEGSLIFFSLLTVYWLIEMIYVEHSANAQGFMRRLPALLRHVILGLLLGFLVDSKQTGLFLAAAPVVTLAAIGLLRSRSAKAVLYVGVSVLIGVAIWWLLNPAYWNNPLEAMRTTIEARSELLSRQVQTPAAYTNVGDRLMALISQPFLSPPQYFEAPTWANVLDSAVSAYERSAFDGWNWGWLMGTLLTSAALMGLVVMILDARRGDLMAWAVLIWIGAVIVYSLLIPLAWQRYYLPLTLNAIVLAAAGLGRLLVRRDAKPQQS